MDIVFWQLSFTLPPYDDDHMCDGQRKSWDTKESWIIFGIWLSDAALRFTLMTPSAAFLPKTNLYINHQYIHVPSFQYVKIYSFKSCSFCIMIRCSHFTYQLLFAYFGGVFLPCYYNKFTVLKCGSVISTSNSEPWTFQQTSHKSSFSSKMQYG